MGTTNYARPNVLWICTDQQRFDTLGCYGNRLAATPNIDRLAGAGTKFDAAFCQSPVCTPSRASFLTGRYPRTCRARQNGAAIPETEVLVSRLFAEAGYRCGLAGKLHLKPCFPDSLAADGKEARIDDGYDVFQWSHNSSGMGIEQNAYHDWLHSIGLSWVSTPLDGSSHVNTAMARDTSQIAWCVDAAIDFMQANNDSPWFFSVNPFDPHDPFDPPMEFLEPYLGRLDDIPVPDFVPGELDDKPPWQMYDHIAGAYGGSQPQLAYASLSEKDHRLIRASYQAMCDQIDYHIGRVLDELDALEQARNTIVVFTSDHGVLHGDHGIYFKGPFFYEPAVRVPLIISMAGTIECQTYGGLVELLDIPQTLLEAAGIDPHEGMMGKSLWPLLTGQTGTSSHRSDVYCESYASCEGHNGESSLPAYATMLRTETYKIVVAHGHPTGELYDLRADPGEHRNLWNDKRFYDTKMKLLLRLADRQAYTADPLPVREAIW